MKWISCKNGLPFRNQSVLAIVRTIVNHHEYVDNYQVVWRDSENGEWRTSPKGRVLYWLPIPTPPEEKKDE